MLCLHWSFVHQALNVPQEKGIQWSEVRGPGYWASMSNPSAAKGFIQILTDDISAVCRCPIMLEPHFMTHYQRHHFQQLRTDCSVKGKQISQALPRSCYFTFYM
ncbi:uncharacterized protein LOC111861884 [Cryptotermes secundus]|uniref:uncharacterized protein LOC111861884 n=1 Tax=Cryptotermes secundus TaxID=105785 RepID=UPI000CD7BA3E|nr:uncharacterized protein LOC111861884 [Cryptotermes secundus]